MRKAFSLIELIIAMMVLSIVVAIASKVIFQSYESYIYAKRVQDANSAVTATLHTLASHLSYRIHETFIGRDNVEDPFMFIERTDGTQTVFEWFNRDQDSMLGEFNATVGQYVPGWTGLIDIDNGLNSTTVLVTPGSQLSAANNIIEALSNGDVSLNPANPVDRPALVFLGEDRAIEEYGWSGSASPAALSVTMRDNRSFNVDIAENMQNIFEHYALVRTATGVYIDQANLGNDGYFQLRFVTNYQPWEGEVLDVNNSTLLLDKVTSFGLWPTGGFIRVKVCVDLFPEDNSDLRSFCKEDIVL